MTPEVKKRIDQIRQGIVPDGYKKTKSGILPESWSVRTIAECLERVEHPVEVQANEMYTQIGIRSHGKGLFYKEPVTGDSLGNKSVFWIEPDCFILNIVFAWEQAIGKTTQAEVGMIGSHRFPMYRPINGSIDIDYLISYLLTKRGTDILEAASPGGAGRNRTLGQDRFMKSRIVLPPLDEQQKIAEILSTQDKVIELQERKIDELKRFKKGCLEKMFPRKGQKVPEKRFPGFTDDWEQRKLGDISEIKTGPFGSTLHADDYVSDGIPIITTEHFKTGALPRSKNGLPQVSDADYKRLTSYTLDDGDIVFSRVGSVDINALITPFQSNWLFSGRVLRVRPRTDISSQFLHTRLETESIKSDIRARAVGQTMPSINTEILKITPLVLPTSAAEQEQIGSYFAAIDNLITLHQCKLEEMKRRKKALMQLLLTGIVRV